MALALLVLCWLGPPATVAVAAPVFDPVPLIEQWLLPRYDRLVSETAAQRQDWTDFCATPAPNGLDRLRSRFDAVADSWTAVEFITFGPVMLNLRADRFNLFPDRRNSVERAIADVISDPELFARLEPQRFAKGSAAVQGLPALERLIYGDAAAQLANGSPEAGRRCALGLAIAGNLATIAADIRAGWGDRNAGLLAQLASARSDPVFFPDPSAVDSQLITDLAGAYQRAVDTRLLPVLGTGPAEARPRLGERWRSGQSGHVVTVMVGSADALVALIAGTLPDRPRSVVEKALAAASDTLATFPADLGPAAEDPTGRDHLAAAIKTFKAVQRAVYRPIATYFGIPLGFNALDGD